MNVNGAGPWSDVALITAASVPSAPKGAPVYVSSTDAEILLELRGSDDDGGMPITGYDLEIDQGSLSASLLDGGTSTFTAVLDYDFSTHGFSYTVDAVTLGLSSGMLYTFRFRAKNYMGSSGYSDTLRIGLGALPPSVPTGPIRFVDDPAADLKRNSKTSIGLEWGDIATTALPVYEYVVFVDDGIGADTREAYRGPLTYARIGGLTPGVSYTF